MCLNLGSPGLEISNNGFAQQYQTTPFSSSRDQILLQAQAILSSAKFSYPGLDWKHAFVWNLSSVGATNGYYVRVTVPTSLGSYRLLNDNAASDIEVTFDASDHFNMTANNGTTYNTFSSLGNFSVISLSQAKKKLKNDGGYLNCVDVERYLVDEDSYGFHCDHVILKAGYGEFSLFDGKLSSVSITSDELVYIKVRNPLYPSTILIQTTEPAYYFIPAYRFSGTAIAHYDLTKTVLNSGNQPTNDYAVERDGKKHIFSVIVPAVDQF